jgi:methyl-accepting chemotaxis protein
MIKAIQAETKAAVNAMEEGVREVEKGAMSSMKSGEALQEILSEINGVTMQINQIATAAEEQTATTSEITTNIQQVTEVVNQSARGAEETSAAAAQLAEQARQLQSLVDHFRVA